MSSVPLNITTAPTAVVGFAVIGTPPFSVPTVDIQAAVTSVFSQWFLSSLPLYRKSFV